MKISFVFCFFLLISVPLFSQSEALVALIKEGIELHDNGKYKEAIEKYEAAAKIDPKNTSVNYEMANTYVALNDYKKAIKFADKVIDLKDSNLDEAYMLKGTALDMSGKPKDAIKVYKAGIKSNPKSYLLHFNLGITLTQEKEYKEAELSYLEAIRNKPSHASSHLQLGNIGTIQKSKTKGLLSYYFYLLLDPNNKFSKLAYTQIQDLMPMDAEQMKDKDKPNVFNIVLPSGGDIEVSSLDLLLSIIPLGENIVKDSLNLKIKGAKNAADSASIQEALDKITPKNAFAAFAKKNETFFKSIGEINEKKDGKVSFWWSFYAAFFAELQKNGHTEAFSYYISQPSKDASVKNWLKENDDKVKKFSKWISSYEFPK
jgi:tetratricopeptide (TPR) repeat protein